MISLKLNRSKLPINIETRVHSVVRPATWRNESYILSYIIVNRNVTANELIILLQLAVVSGLHNPRVITPEIIMWSSLFHPRFFKSINEKSLIKIGRLKLICNNLSADFDILSRYCLQSILFLSGVTLSAAIIQHRFSSGTIGSKLDRLWDAGTLAHSGVAKELIPLQLHDCVSFLALNTSNEITRLINIREIFMKALELIAPTTGTIEMMKKSRSLPYSDGRFDFKKILQDKLGSNLKAIIVYGSSVSSDQFADIDAVVIVNDPISALTKLAGTSPSWIGKELNIGIYSPSEFLVMQRISGDNLSEYGICIFGETEVVRKEISELLFRNFSFGVIRQRQQFGMLSREISTKNLIDADRKKLYEYFVKIPANVAKGTFGAVGRRLPKEQIHEWLLSTIGFNTIESQRQAISGDVVGALASSSIATGCLLSALNKELNVFKTSQSF